MDQVLCVSIGNVGVFSGELEKAIAQEKKTLEFLKSKTYRTQFSPNQFDSVVRGVEESISKYEAELSGGKKLNGQAE